LTGLDPRVGGNDITPPMGHLIPRYVLADLLKVFGIALAGLTVLMLLVGVLRQALDEGLGLKYTLLLIPYILPDALRFTIPATALFAASCVFGRMAGNNETVALKSLGISPWAVLWPAYGAAFLLSLVTVWLNDVAVSWGRDGVRRVVIGALEDIVLSRLALRHEYSARNFSVIVKDVEDRRLIQPTFTFRPRREPRLITLHCQYAQLESDGQVLRLRCYHGEGGDGEDWEYKFPNSWFEHEFELEDLRRDDTPESPSNKPLAEIYRQLEEVPRKAADIHRELACKAALQLLAGDFQALLGKEWQTEDHDLHILSYQFFRLRTEPYRRLATGFSCLSFVLVGSGMAMRLRNANVLSSFFLCFLPILIVYYPLLTFSVDQAKNGSLPPGTVWLGNVVLALWWLWLMRRVLRY
jgi:lipopolysaccharide export system permease protein